MNDSEKASIKATIHWLKNLGSEGRLPGWQADTKITLKWLRGIMNLKPADARRSFEQLTPLEWCTNTCGLINSALVIWLIAERWLT